MTYMRQEAIVFLLLSSAMLSACMVPDDIKSVVGENSTTASARTEMVGLSESELRMCAGFPDATADAGPQGQIWSFRRSAQRGNTNLVVPATTVGVLPAVGGAINVAPSGYCHTQVRLVDGRVAEVEFSGDNNRPSGLNALCATMVDSCVAYARRKAG
jgi:hypothetical protein